MDSSCDREKNIVDDTKIGKENHSVDKNKWGYIVCSGVVITFIAGIGHVNSFGLIYNDFIVDTNSTVRSLTMSHGVFAVMLAFGGLILNIIFKKHSMRVGGFIGAAVFATGSVLTVFITSTNQLPLTFGALQGIGFGMMTPVCYSTLNYYYIRKRTQVMSIIKAIQGFILMWYPQLIKILMSYYGFRGTLLLIAGVSLHTFPGMAVMWKNEHVKRNNRTAKDNTVKVEENVDLLSIEDGKQTVGATKSGIVHKSKVKKFWEDLWRLLNIKVLKDPIFCNICVGQSFVNFSDLTFFVLQPMLLFQYGYSTTEVAACISIATGADVAGRCILAVMSSIMSVNTRVLYYVATLFTFLMRIVMLHVRRISFVFAVTGALGMLRGWLHVASPLVISNQVSHEDFPGAYALSLLASGLVNVTFAPFIVNPTIWLTICHAAAFINGQARPESIRGLTENQLDVEVLFFFVSSGLVKDIYGDYVPAFYALVVCCAPCLMLWPLEYKLLKRQDQ